jgi:hypothetical protein
MFKFVTKIRMAPTTVFLVAVILLFNLSGNLNNIDIVLNTSFISKVQAQAPGVNNGSNADKAGSSMRPIKASIALTGTQKDPTLFSKNDISVLQKLVARRELIAVRSEELTLREGLLGAAEKRIDKKILELKKLIVALEKAIKKKNK